MKIQQVVAGLIVLSIFALVPIVGFAQISSGADAVLPTQYSSGSQDNIHIFCGNKGDTNASLTATSPGSESANFEWQKYNAASGGFDLYVNDQSGNTTSAISGLQDGCYRVIITSTSGTKTTFTAWVFNDYLETTAEISESDCTSFTLKGTVTPTTFTYVDLTNGQPKVLNKDIQVKWMDGANTVSKFIIAKMYSPPTKDTDYTLHVSDISGCFTEVVVRYTSIVTKASFTYTTADQKGIPTGKTEAPLTVTFTNTSENGDLGKYEWFIYKDRDEIIREAEANPGKVIDSIMTKIYSDSPIYIFEKTGTYNVKLVSQKKSEFTTCYDTVYIDEMFVIDESFIKAPSFFTPNGDSANESFMVQFFSMKSVKISIFNRWGKLVHVWESNNVQGFGATVEAFPQSIWDGKVGGKVAVPGVYYYVAEGIGRDDKKRTANGFFHLFRGK